MSISSLLFLFIFLPFSLVVYYISSDSSKEFVLVAISILFYSLAGINFVFLFLLSLIITVIIGRSIFYSKSNIVRQILLIMGIIYNAVILIYYKNIGHLLSTLFSLSVDSISADSIMLPVGLSFYSFKSISYLADVKKGEAVLDNNVIHDFLYLSFFSQIQSGPISRYNDLKKVNENIKDSFSDGVIRFMVGFNKKMLIANVLSKISNEIFCTPFENFSTSLAWLGAISFSLQLLFDFAGYSDMAIGLGKMFGFDFLENFNYPYISSSITEFWRRWHISLSTWFKEYVYIPLGGNRVSKLRNVFNVFVVFLLTGVWHGAANVFIAWGLWHGILNILEKLTGFNKKSENKIVLVIQHVYTLFAVLIGWVFFRSSSMKSGVKYILGMLGLGKNVVAYKVGYFVSGMSIMWILIGMVLSLPLYKLIFGKTDELKSKNNKLSIALDVMEVVYLLSLFVLCVSALAGSTYNPFIYFRF